MFSDKDLQQIKAKGITLDEVGKQLQFFRQGVPFTNLVEAATIGNGILKFSKKEQEQFVTYFEKECAHKALLKFVPASGAATRMFKFLYEFLEAYQPEKESTNAFINKYKANQLSMFFIGAEKFPFYTEVLKNAKAFYPEWKNFTRDQKRVAFVKTMLDADKLNYSAYPKGLLPFHQYRNHESTAFSEHLFEAASYATSNNLAKLHFTISPIHHQRFKEEFKQIEAIVERKTNTTFEIDFSYQNEQTDTIAVTPKNQPFRESNGDLVFRPSGHGALIENLNQQQADIIFIKNIDNVVVSHLGDEVAFHKKVLAGKLLTIQEKVFTHLKALENDLDETKLNSIAQFLKEDLNAYISPEFKRYAPSHKCDYLKEKLDKPIRICGMVKNEGEPGGGPFWIKNKDGEISLQIVESAQINKKNKQQKAILQNASHFNPVDIVCGIKNYKGEKFDLTKFVDEKAVFISAKTKSGKQLKALELPGLWNGAMAFWNTIFVEVPLSTFNPVKTVNDLLKSSHQAFNS